MNNGHKYITVLPFDAEKGGPEEAGPDDVVSDEGFARVGDEMKDISAAIRGKFEKSEEDFNSGSDGGAGKDDGGKDGSGGNEADGGGEEDDANSSSERYTREMSEQAKALLDAYSKQSHGSSPPPALQALALAILNNSIGPKDMVKLSNAEGKAEEFTLKRKLDDTATTWHQGEPWDEDKKKRRRTATMRSARICGRVSMNLLEAISVKLCILLTD